MVRPPDAVEKERKQLALDYAAELERPDARLKELKKRLAEVLAEHPRTLAGIDGIVAINAAKTMAEVGDVCRFILAGGAVIILNRRVAPAVHLDMCWVRSCAKGLG